MSKSKRTKRRPSLVVTTHIIADFLCGLSFVGLARKYARTVKQIEAIIRRSF